MVKTSLGMGRVVGTIIPLEENESLLAEGLKIIKEWNPDWSPLYTMTDKSSVELGAIGKVHPTAIRLLCDFHRSQAWERWVNKNSNGVLPQDRATVLDYLKDLAYAKTGTRYESFKACNQAFVYTGSLDPRKNFCYVKCSST